jgi:2-polyprenyl-6-methoxyphenol hydroxylase-like FAD-dependent oxidoreductase
MVGAVNAVREGADRESAVRIGVVGGSIAGCAGALAAARAVPQATVVVFERSGGELRDRGAGIGIQHERFAELVDAGFLDASLPATPGHSRDWFTRDGVSADGGGVSGRGKLIWRQPFPFNSYNWGHLYRSLRGRLPARVEFRSDARVVSAASTESRPGASVTLADGSVEHFDLLLGADGYRSVVREAMFPGVVPDYAGYLCWRGLSDFAELTELPQDSFSTVGFHHGHLVAYPIPADDGRRHFNWVLYSAVPPELTGDLRKATSIPPGAVSRPHAAAGTVKAMQDAASLLDLWRTTPDLDELAARYDAARGPAGAAVTALARRIGAKQVLDTPDWAAFGEAEFAAWLSAQMHSADGTEMGGRRL